MKTLTKSLIAVSALALAPVLASTAAQAQVATADFDRAVQETNSFKTAMSQLQVTYKTQLDQVESRRGVLVAELNALVVRYQADQKANPNGPTIKTQENAIRAKQQAADEEVQRLSLPIARARAFVNEQYAGKLDAAVKGAMTKKKIGLVISPEAIMAIAPGNDLTPDITAELNVSVPSVNTNVPAGWQPGQAKPATGAAAPVAPVTPPKPAPQGR
jgi:Skp family chaperone for outer membrane proteins